MGQVSTVKARREESLRSVNADDVLFFDQRGPVDLKLARRPRQLEGEGEGEGVLDLGMADAGCEELERLFAFVGDGLFGGFIRCHFW